MLLETVRAARNADSPDHTMFLKPRKEVFSALFMSHSAITLIKSHWGEKHYKKRKKKFKQ